MKAIITLLLCLIKLSACAQQTIYVAPAPRTYWQQREDNRREALQLQTERTRQAESELENALAENARCASEIRNYYASISDYPTVADGVYKVHATDGYYFCNEFSALVRDGKVVKLGFESITGTELVKNAKTKVLYPFRVGSKVRTLVMDIYFVY